MKLMNVTDLALQTAKAVEKYLEARGVKDVLFTVVLTHAQHDNNPDADGNVDLQMVTGFVTNLPTDMLIDVLKTLSERVAADCGVRIALDGEEVVNKKGPSA